MPGNRLNAKWINCAQWNLTTDAGGRVAIRTNRVLRGYTLTLAYENEVLDVFKVA